MSAEQGFLRWKSWQWTKQEYFNYSSYPSEISCLTECGIYFLKMENRLIYWDKTQAAFILGPQFNHTEACAQMTSFLDVRVWRNSSIPKMSKCTARNCVGWEWVCGAVSEAKLKASCILQNINVGPPCLTCRDWEKLINLDTEIEVGFGCTSAVQWAWSAWLLQMWEWQHWSLTVKTLFHLEENATF